MTKQALEAEMERITNEYKDMSERGLSDYGLKQALLKTVDRYVEERERLARVDEIYYWFNRYSNGRVGISNQLPVSKKIITNRIEALRQQVKGKGE